jgi:predicted small lipoprotein YifL
MKVFCRFYFNGLLKLDFISSVAAVLVAMAVITGVSACGKKGPPMPPESSTRPEQVDLQAEVDGDRVTLRWRPIHSTAVVAGYDIFRASHPLSGPSCPACHQQFHKIDSLTVASDTGADAREITFCQQVPPGFRYTYKVRPFDRNGELGADSDQAGVDVP